MFIIKSFFCCSLRLESSVKISRVFQVGYEEYRWKRIVAGAAPGNGPAGGAQILTAETDDWGTPAGAPQVLLVASAQEPPKQAQQYQKGDLQSLTELPVNCWTKVPNDHRGIQFFTKVKIGTEFSR